MKAVFLDRDGVINELVYHRDQGIIDSPFTLKQLRLLPGVGEAIKTVHKMGYKVVLVSNQPGVAKGHMSEETFESIREKIRQHLSNGKDSLDGEYYCLHHPEATVEKFRINCECRKPKPGLLIQAAREMNLDLAGSWMIGDGLTDVAAGKAAGCRTILVGKMKCELCHLMDRENARPDAVVPDIIQAAAYILGKEA